MKVAVSARGTSLEDTIDEHFGRAAYLLIVDVDTFGVEVLDNTRNRNVLHGAGLGAAESVDSAGAAAVVTGHLGPKAYRALTAIDIPGYSGAGMTVRQAVEAFAQDRLERLNETDSHQGLQ